MTDRMHRTESRGTMRTRNDLPGFSGRTPAAVRSGFSFSLLSLCLLLGITTGSSAQQTVADSAVAQTVRTTRGYMIRIPSVARLDSARSGWNPTMRFEQRVYTIAGTGQIVLRVEVGKDSIPEGASSDGSYTWVDSDSLSSNGTVYSRTWYLPHRRVRITFTPWALAMKRWTDQRETIYHTFRWDEGADSEVEDLTPTTPPLIQPETKRGLGR